MSDLTVPSDPATAQPSSTTHVSRGASTAGGSTTWTSTKITALRAVGPAVLARTRDDVKYEVTASQAHLRLPVNTSTEVQRHAHLYHRGVVQLVGIPDDDELEILYLNVQPSVARSLAAILVRAADHVEGLAR